MENLEQKAQFLRKEYIDILASLDAHAPRKWGKMNVQQMIEHMADYVRIASGKTPTAVVTPEENLQRMQGFLESEKPFRENTPNALMPDTPEPARHRTKDEAIHELQQEIEHFFMAHERDGNKTTANPFFGNLNFNQQIQLLHKHATHHLRQFGLNY